MVDILTLREEWSVYQLETGKEFRLKLSIIRADISRRESSQVAFDAMYSPLVYAEPSPDDSGTPSTDQTITAKDIIAEPKFEPKFESVNVYDIPKERLIILVKPILRRVAVTEKFGLDGKRIYQTTLDVGFSHAKYP